MKRGTLFILAVAMLTSSREGMAVDRASRDDTADFRQRLLPVPKKPDGSLFALDGTQPGPSLSFLASITGLYATNAGQTPHDFIDTVYGTPTLEADFTSSRVVSGWTTAASIILDSDAYARDHKSLDESRVSGNLLFSPAAANGVISFGVRDRVSFTSGYHHYNYNRFGPVLDVSPAFGSSIKLLIEGEFRLSDDADQRRELVDISGEKTWSLKRYQGGNEITLKVKQGLRFSAFRAGDNDGRRDMRSATTASLGLGLFRAGSPYSLTFDATLYHNFSNRSDARYTDLEVGPTLTRTLP